MVLLLYHVLPSVISGTIFFLLIKFIIFIFRIKHPSIKALLYILVLYKSVEAMLVKSVYISSINYSVAFRIIDPLNTIPAVFDNIPTFSNFSILTGGPIYIQILVDIIIFGFIIVLGHWLLLWRFYSNLSDKYIDGECPKIEKIVEKYSEILKVNKPKIALSSRNYSLPVIVGFLKPTLVLSPKMIDELSDKKLEIIIAHELSHIKRRDNLFQWLTLILKDLTFFNPLSYFAYKNYIKYKERATNNFIKLKTSIIEEDIVECATVVRKFINNNMLKELPSASHFLLVLNSKKEKLFKLNIIKIIPLSVLFYFLLSLQWIVVLPLGK